MKITLRGNGHFLHACCCICGEGFKLSDVIAVVDGEEIGNGDVCYQCIRAGADGMKHRARECAERMAAMAADAERFADELQSELIDAPTETEWEAERTRFYAEAYGVSLEELETRERENAEAGLPPF